MHLTDHDGIAATYQPIPESVRAARLFVAGLLPDELRDEAMLLTSELATNALLYAGESPFEVRVRLTPTRRVEVRDASVVIPTASHPAPEDARGRGLHLVDAIASAWGIIPDEIGKVVWFEL